LPDIAAVIAHSTTPLRSAPRVSAKGITTGTRRGGDQLRLADRGGADPAPGQVGQAREGPAAEHHLRGVGVHRPAARPVAFPQQGRRGAAAKGGGAPQGRHVRVEDRQVYAVQFRVVRRGEAEEDVAEGNHAEADELEHFLAADAAAVERGDLRPDAAVREFGDARVPERLLVPDILPEVG
jgi:hypothetical protein